MLCDYFNVPQINMFNQPDGRGVALTHIPFSPEIKMRADIIRGPYLIRDLRDIVASFYPYTQTDQFKRARPEYRFDSVENFYYDWFLSIIVPQYRVHTFADEYAQLGVPVIRYERLYDDTLGEMENSLNAGG